MDCIENNNLIELQRELIQNRVIKYITVVGKSMVPILIPDDKVFINPYNGENIKKKDIIVFTKNNKLIIHRIVEIQGKHIITKGDNSPKADGIINENSILAVASGKNTTVYNRLNVFCHYFRKKKYKKAFGVLKYGIYKF